jgi:hypothetical protein
LRHTARQLQQASAGRGLNLNVVSNRRRQDPDREGKQHEAAWDLDQAIRAGAEKFLDVDRLSRI